MMLFFLIVYKEIKYTNANCKIHGNIYKISNIEKIVEVLKN